MSNRKDAATRRAALEQLLRAYEAVFASPEGALVLADLYRETGLLAVSHTPGDPHETAYAEGRRSIGLHLLWRRKQNFASLERLAEQGAQAGLPDDDGDRDDTAQDHFVTGDDA